MAFLGVAGLLLLGVFALACTFVYLAPGMPTAENAQAVPMRVYDSSGRVISQIGEQRRIPVTYEEIPDIVRKAVLAAEDDRFFDHHGIDWMGVTRAVVTNVVSLDATGQGGSTITQQAARNMFLTLDQTPRRKLSEVFVTYRMERDYSKEEILAIYLNVALFGHRSYGIAAAAQTYYGKHLEQLTVAQAATLAGLLPAPSRYNPISNPRNAEVRRGYVLGRMVKLGFIDEATAAAAAKEPIGTHDFGPREEIEAPYVADMVLQELTRLFGRAAVNQGYKVYTTIDGRLQTAATRAVRLGLLGYDRRHGYKGPRGKVQVPAGATAGALDELLGKFESVGLLQTAVVTKIGEKSAEVHIRNGGSAKIEWEGLSWASKSVNKLGDVGPRPGKAADVVAVGDVIFVLTDNRGSAQLVQLPEAQSAFVAMDPVDGAIVALVGGFDFHQSNFNRAMQANRQPASGFKPFIYSAALENGFTAATTILNLPLADTCNENEEECWHPQNAGGGYSGLVRLRDALVGSLNYVSIRILQEIGVDTAIEHAAKFGFRKDSLPRNLTLALGTQTVRPIEMVTGYSVIANGGFKVEPYFISRIEDAKGKVVFEAKPKIACLECEQAAAPPVADVVTVDTALAPAAAEAAAATPDAPAAEPTPAPPPLLRIHDVDAPPALRELALNQGGSSLPADRLAPRVVSAQNVWLMSDIMHDITVRGTAARARRELQRDDMAGKTGTNEERDNWFHGFTRNLVASVWVGFDDERPLGKTEQGASTALPIWINFMREALDRVPQSRLERPGGLVDLRVSTTTGLLADQNDPTAVFETFMADHLPKAPEGGAHGSAPGTGGSAPPMF